MESPVELMRVSIALLAESLQPDTYAMIPTSRGLDAVIDRRFETQVKSYRWYAILSRGNYLAAAADVGGRRISLQRFVLTLAHPTMTLDEVKQVSFANKLPFDCRLENISGHIGRTAVMRNRRSKAGTSSIFKGVIKRTSTSGAVRWAASIATQEIRYNLGYHHTERLAALAYDAAAYLLFENAALYNLPDICPDPRRWSLCVSVSLAKNT
ncbi:hypothetical protein [Tabrizicola sp.]|uniref:hypothetical protein n=1 Tax=Tabrizicola sp. TaxID=2005166 RepID=UPI0025D5207E|nr:hypothetical protein [Tabrizicola sp.]